MRRDASAFTLVEVLLVVVILGILAAVVVPQMSVSTEQAKDATLLAQLRIARTTIERFKHEHNGNAPGWTGIDPVVHFNYYTDADGAISMTKTAQHKFGPYLNALQLKNPFNDAYKLKTSVDPAAEVPDEAMMFGGYVVGWFYDKDTGRISANAEGTTSDGTPRVQL